VKWRALYVCLLRLHPAAFRCQFAEEMLWIFDEFASRESVVPLLADALKSLCRQWILRPVCPAQSHTPQVLAGVPGFQPLEHHGLSSGALVNGALISVLTFAGVLYCCSLRGGHWEGLKQAFYSLEARSLNPADQGDVSGAPSDRAVNEFAADDVEGLVRRIMVLDLNGDGAISKAERLGPIAERYRNLLDRADTNHDGEVTEEELRREIFVARQLGPGMR
jgi:hypothetical protein